MRNLNLLRSNFRTKLIKEIIEETELAKIKGPKKVKDVINNIFNM